MNLRMKKKHMNPAQRHAFNWQRRLGRKTGHMVRVSAKWPDGHSVRIENLKGIMK